MIKRLSWDIKDHPFKEKEIFIKKDFCAFNIIFYISSERIIAHSKVTTKSLPRSQNDTEKKYLPTE